MSRMKIDKIDKKILSLLQDNGRISNVDLAKAIGISPPPCLRRLRALENSGYIKGYHAALKQESLGFTVTIFAMVLFKQHAEEDIQKFSDCVDRWPMVRESHFLAGDGDCLLKIIAKDWDDYQNFLRQDLMKAPNVGQVRSNLSIGSPKNIVGVPILDV